MYVNAMIDYVKYFISAKIDSPYKQKECRNDLFFIYIISIMVIK